MLIQVGQLADLIVPDRDYFSCPQDEIADTTSHLTIVGGKVVYGAGDFAGLDQINVPVLLSLQGSGVANVIIKVNQHQANMVTVDIE